jgi:hypothetical protein
MHSIEPLDGSVLAEVNLLDNNEVMYDFLLKRVCDRGHSRTADAGTTQSQQDRAAPHETE